MRSQAARAAFSYSFARNWALAASSRWRSAVLPVTSRASNVVVGAVDFLPGPAPGGGGMGRSLALFGGAGLGWLRSTPRLGLGGVGAGVGAGVCGGVCATTALLLTGPAVGAGFFFFAGGLADGESSP